MKLWIAVSLLCAAAWAQTAPSPGPGPGPGPVPSPYAAERLSPVRGLSAQEVDDLLNGRGMGLARTAELQSYPGPRHVLELKQQLALSDAVVAQVEAVFKQMDAQARRLGREIVEREKQFSAEFAAGKITAAAMQAREPINPAEELGRMYGKLRAIHLRAHLEMRPLLTSAQVHKYNLLRGYWSGSDGGHTGHATGRH